MNKLILIIEDEEDILELLEYTLQKEGYETVGFLNIDKNVRKVLDEENVDLREPLKIPFKAPNFYFFWFLKNLSPILTELY